MTLLKIALVGVAIAAMLGAAKQQRWFERAGLVSSCAIVAPPAGQPVEGAWYSCSDGLLTGLPTLEGDSCTSTGVAAGRELWHCPVVLSSTPGF